MKAACCAALLSSLVLGCSEKLADSSRAEDVPLDPARVIAIAVDSIHGSVGRQARIVFPDRALTTDSMGYARLGQLRHASAVIDAVASLEGVEVCRAETCAVPQGVNNDHMIACTIPVAGGDRLKTYCVASFAEQDAVWETAYQIIVGPQRGELRITKFTSYHIS